MSKARKLTDDEFMRDWSDIWRKVLGRDELRFFLALGEPFDKPDWVQTALPNSFIVLSAPLDQGWPQGYPEKLKIGHDFEPLLKALQERGTSEVIVSCITGNAIWDKNDAERGFTQYGAFEPSMDGLDAMRGMDFLDYHSLCFSREADWGLVGTMDKCSILAATPEFMERFFHHAGGKDVVRLRFYWYDDCYDWGMADDSDAQIIETLYGIAGWPLPEYTKWKHGPYDEDKRDIDIERPAWTREFQDKETT